MQPFIAECSVGIIMTVIVTLFEEGNFFGNGKRIDSSEQLKKEMIESRYEALKNQMNPHFLFNSLSSLTALVHKTRTKRWNSSVNFKNLPVCF
jgi:sensor histidine kinase YesM